VSREQSRRILFAVWMLILLGGVVFASTVGLIGYEVRTAALTGLAGVVLVQLALTVDPAWLLSAGIVSTMFAWHWELLSLSSSIGPHRILVAAGILALLLRSPSAAERPALRLSGVHLVLAAALAYVVVSAIVAGTLGRPT
jgi:hypothetical protein